MSCFVIEKSSFAKAAGIVAGIADAANAGNSMDRFWLYDSKLGRNMTGTDYLEAFTKVYEMNLRSVSESWKEILPADTADYTNEFKAAVKVGKKAYSSRWENGGYLRTVQELRNFFQGVRYQIDNPVLEKKVASFLDAITVRLFAQLDADDNHDSWGSLDLATFETILAEEQTQARNRVKTILSI